MRSASPCSQESNGLKAKFKVQNEKYVVYPFALSLSKGRSWFDKLTTNGI